MLAAPESSASSKYRPPSSQSTARLSDLLGAARIIPSTQQARLLLPGVGESESPLVYYSGDASLLQQKCVAIVGARKVSAHGAARARKLAKSLAEAGIVVVSGLAAGVDTEALTACISAGGQVIAVIGTPLGKAYPAANAMLQQSIYENHLLISPYPQGHAVGKWSFPQRNKLMAAVSDATVIIEASDTSGTLHQAAECQSSRLDRWLFIAQSVIDDKSLTWPQRFLSGSKVRPLRSAEDVLGVL